MATNSEGMGSDTVDYIKSELTERQLRIDQWRRGYSEWLDLDYGESKNMNQRVTF